MAVVAKWGNPGKGGVTMLGTGKAEPRDFNAAERAALGAVADLLGPDTLDIYWNNVGYWSNVPRRTWEYTVGGYQVVKKWLSYRERAILGRLLRLEEVVYVGKVCRRITALLVLGPELDANYHRAKADAAPLGSDRTL